MHTVYGRIDPKYLYISTNIGISIDRRKGSILKIISILPVPQYYYNSVIANLPLCASCLIEIKHLTLEHNITVIHVHPNLLFYKKAGKKLLHMIIF